MAPTMKTAKQRAMEYFKSLAPGEAKLGYATDAYKDQDGLAYALSRVPMLTPRPLRIIALGAGFGGIALARAVRVGEIPGANLTIFEKDAGIGGTWYENRYPGCACDVPAHSYQYTWAPNPNWRSFYAPQRDIQKYLEDVCEQHDLWQYIKVSHKVVGAKWVEERQVWEVTVTRTDGRDLVISSPGVTEGETDDTWVEECDVFVNAGGFFNNWKWPSIPGREQFKGRSLHTAHWPHDADKDIDGKTVALIGNGSSGIQVLPAIIDRVEKIYVHIRSPTWIIARIGEKFAGPKGTTLVFTEEQKKRWREHPEEYLKYRKDVENDVNERFLMYMDHTPEQEAARKYCVENLAEKLKQGGKPEWIEPLTPDFAVGCRRPTPGTGYLEALMSPKCELVWGDVTAFTENGLRSINGVESHVDTVICATGFELSCAPRFPIIGRNNMDLQQCWHKAPESYLSVAAADMPNYFTILGPASPLGHGSLTTSIEFVAHYIAKMCRKLATENYASFCPKPHVPRAYQKHALAFLARTVWASSCTSTYKNGKKDGELRSLHPGSRLQLFTMLTNPRYEDYDWKSLCEDEDLAFAWMACGFTYEEMMDKTADLTWFINPDKNAKIITVDHHAAKTNGTNGVNGANGVNGTKPQDSITVQ
ncbi:hypothetical protein VTN00DRAFT_5772 [Thermoascus crustaceus]|uniref:uncharacterized protein n=1 Tax=Thermoascus crustaceus TaxID=5088 RepID=UPI003744846D